MKKKLNLDFHVAVSKICDTGQFLENTTQVAIDLIAWSPDLGPSKDLRNPCLENKSLKKDDIAFFDRLQIISWRNK